MLLVDKDMKSLIEKGKFIINGFNQNNLNGVSYDITVDSIIDGNSNLDTYELAPNSIVIVRCKEVLLVPDDIVVRVAEKNSLIRQGIKVEGPHYHPGHKTYIFLRVQNLTSESFLIRKDLNIAQLMCEQLTQIPEVTYDKQKNSSFNLEKEYRGTGKYKKEYDNLSKKFENAKNELESMKEKIYANVITIMGIFVSIFTLVSVNIQSFVHKEISPKLIGTVNFCLLTSVVILIGMIALVVNKKSKLWFQIVYGVIALALIVSTFIICCF